MPLPLLPLAGIALTAALTPAGVLLRRRLGDRPDPLARPDEDEQHKLDAARIHLRGRLVPLGMTCQEVLTGALHRFGELRDQLRNLDPDSGALSVTVSGAVLAAPGPERLARIAAAAARSPAALALWGPDAPASREAELMRWMPDDSTEAEEPAALARATRALTREVIQREELIGLLLSRIAAAQERLALVLHLESDYRSLSPSPLPGALISPRDVVSLNHRYAAVLAALVCEPLLDDAGAVRALPGHVRAAHHSVLRLTGWR